MRDETKREVIQSSINLFNRIKNRWENGYQLEPHEIEWLLSMTELYFRSKVKNN